ncbi:phosphomannomutase [Hyphomonas sp.]|uniref:phosphomannomutase n=1 Tax=Hyphomonas sp. TaxID=87 RepID=UPI0025BB32FC|nr:phosphomannomutase [Hyphomonas sp.]
MSLKVAEITARSGVAFGTSGARGLVTGFTPEVCLSLTQGFLKLPGIKRGTVLLGHDLRPSSPGIARAVIAAAEAAGHSVIFAGVLPTPALAYAATQMGLPAIMVTGSHIPFDRNGIKFYRAEGEITKADEQAMMAAEAPLSPLVLKPLPEADPRAVEVYTARCTGALADDALAGLRIGIYEHSGVARDLMHAIFRALGAGTTGLGRTDTFVPIDTESLTPEDRKLGRDWSAEHGFDAIISTDGDADRPLVSDERGQWLRGDVLGILAAKAVGAKTVVTPVNSNTALEKCGAFPHIIRTRIGSPYVLAGMGQATVEPVVGYEANGGFLLGSDVTIDGRTIKALPTRDALLPMLLVLAAARSVGSVSKLLSTLPPRFTHSDRIKDFATEQSRALIARLAGDHAAAAKLMAPHSGKLVNIDTTDGFRASFENGDIVHLRPSGNAPELRCYAEAETAEKAEGLCVECLCRSSSQI